MKKILAAAAGLAVLAIAGLVMLNNYCPILIKYWEGVARDLGPPVNARVYTDSKLNKDIKVYRAKTNWNGQKDNYYVLSLKEYDREGMLKFVNVDLSDTVVGRPVSTNEADYAVMHGHLYQSDVAYNFTDFRDGDKGFGLDPELKFNANEIKFNFPPGWLKFNAIRIELN